MAEEDDKPGIGVSGVVTGVVGAGVGAGAVAGIAHLNKRGTLTDEAKKFIDEDQGKKARDAAKKAFDEKYKGDKAAEKFHGEVKAEVAKIETKAVSEAAKTDGAIAAFKAKKKPAVILKEGLASEIDAAEEKASKEFLEKYKTPKDFDVAAYAEANKGSKLPKKFDKLTPAKAHAEALKLETSAAAEAAEEAFTKAHPKAADYVKVVESKIEKIKSEAVDAVGKGKAIAGKPETKFGPAIAKHAAKGSATDVLAAGAEGHAEYAAATEAKKVLGDKILKPDVAKKIGEEAGKLKDAAPGAGAAAIEKEAAEVLSKTRAVKEANFIKKPFVAFANMGTKGKALAIGVGAVLAVGGAMWMKARHQSSWQERIDAERANAATQTAPAR